MPPYTGSAPKAWALLALLGLLAWSGLWMLYPAWLDGTHVLVGDWRHPDMLSNHWLYEWVADQLGAGRGILHNDRYYHPVGDAPYLAGNGGDAVGYTLARLILPWPAALTAWLLLAVALNALAGWLLCRCAGAGFGGSIFGGSTLAVFSYLAHELSGGRFSQVPLYPLLFFLWAWVGLLQRPSYGRGLLAGLFFSLTALGYWYYGLWAGWMAALLLISWAISRRSTIRRDLSQLALPAATAGVVVFLLVLPVLGLFIRYWALVPGTQGPSTFPHPLSVASSLPPTFPVYAGVVERGDVVLSITALALAVFGAWRWRGWLPRGLLMVAAVFYLLALGPELLLPSGESTGIPGPFRLVYGIHGAMERFWWPYRHVIGVAVAVAVFSAHGLDWILARLPRAVAPLLVGALVLLQPLDIVSRGGTAGAAMSWWEPPEAYQEISRLPGGAVLELPVAPELVSTQQSLVYQLVHGKRLVNGHAMWVDRVRPPAWDDWVDSNTFLKTLQQYERGQLFGPFAFRPEHVALMREQGVRYLVVNAEYLPKALYGLMDRYPVIFGELFGEPVYSYRDHLMVWDLERQRLRGHVDAPEFRLPADYMARDGTRLLEVGHNRALGLRGLSRDFPPELPPGGGAGEGPVEVGPGSPGAVPPASGPVEVGPGSPDVPPPPGPSR